MYPWPHDTSLSWGNLWRTPEIKYIKFNLHRPHYFSGSPKFNHFAISPFEGIYAKCRSQRGYFIVAQKRIIFKTPGKETVDWLTGSCGALRHHKLEFFFLPHRLPEGSVASVRHTFYIASDLRAEDFSSPSSVLVSVYFLFLDSLCFFKSSEVYVEFSFCRTRGRKSRSLIAFFGGR